MFKSTIYDEVFESLGFFNTREEYRKIEHNYNPIQFIGSKKSINENTAIGYFPGCFAAFHDGHVSVIKKALQELKKISNDYLLVVAPTNTEYTVMKYGVDSAYATNYYRYNIILNRLRQDFGSEATAIDLNPMLNARCDFNFTDQLEAFITAHTGANKKLNHTPRIIVGKDRQHYSMLGKLTDRVDFICVEDSTGMSSSAIIKNHPLTIVKKHCLLRCNNYAEFSLFHKYFASEYSIITRVLLENELDRARRLIAEKGPFDFTICKEYAGLLPYVPLSRDFDHALDTPVKFKHGDINFEGKKILDSDIYSGSTKRYVESLGGELVAVFDTSTGIYPGTHEIVDFSDFKKANYCYPFVDVAERCSMRPFTYEMHLKYEQFRNEI